MKKWLIKCICLFIPVYLLVVLINYRVDPANLYHESMVDDILKGLSSFEAVEILGDFDEGKLLIKRIESMEETPEIFIMGPSHALYVDWPMENYFNGAMSGEFIDDYYATVGLLEENGRLPKKMIITVEPYIFMDELSLRQDSLSEYAKLQKSVVFNEKRKEKLKIKNFDKIKELFSFPYFQSSMEALIKGVSVSYVNPVNSLEVGQYTKILKSGKRIPAQSVFQDENQCVWDAEWSVSTGTIYCMTDYEEISGEKVKEFDALVDYLLGRGVTVDLYLPCWIPVFYDEFKNNEKFAGVIKSEEHYREMANERGITVHGSFNPQKCGLGNGDYLDYMHLKPESARISYETILE